ncbi:MAG TPA: hypothetical protein VK483_17720 [Chitinophagaceae bacterium]|nr:hypothetical protein [Chitinophagaceae bacterium]
MKKLLASILLLSVLYTQAQVKIGNNPGTINSNSLLEMESTNKGFLPPRVALNSLSSVSPLSGTVPTGMLVFSTGGTLMDGYYYWNGSVWVMLANAQTNIVTKTADVTLTKTENFVLASNNITITLPVVTSADDGLTITVKHVGSYSDFIFLQGNSGALIDNTPMIALVRWFSFTMTAYGGNWVLKNRTTISNNTLEVSIFSPWQTLPEALEFLDLHMWGPTVIKMGSGSFDLSATQVINLPFSLTIEGTSYGTTTIGAASGLANKPMFRCFSDCYFKKIQFDATTLTNYGTLTGEDAIRLVGSGTYNEIKDCSFDSFNNAILDSSDAELWLFECDITNAKANGLLVQSNMDSVVIKVAETDFINCKLGIDLEKGDKAIIQLSSCGFYNASSSDTAIAYTPSTFTASRDIHITGNSWNNVGKFIDGFDFSRSDARDANAFIQNNAGDGDHTPSCRINVNNNATTTTVTTAGTWYKAVWTNTSSVTTKWTIANNKITYQSQNRRNAFIIITGNISVNNANKTVSIAIVKNGITTTRIGETDLRLTTGSQPYQFSTVVYLSDIGPGDYFELFCTSSSNGDVVIFQDVQWLTESK